MLRAYHARRGLEQHLPVWKPLSKNLYALRLLTRQHQRLQELKANRLTNNTHCSTMLLIVASSTSS